MASLFPSQLEADAQLDAILTDMASIQEAAVAYTGKYDQYCSAVKTIVEDPDTKESREVVSKVLLNETRRLTGATFRATLGVYESALGVGYVVTSTVSDGTNTWTRAVNHGNEVYREQPWTLIRR